MAKTPRGKETNAKKALAEAAKAQAEKVAQQTLVLTPKKFLNDLLDSDNRYKQKIDGLTGELRETIGNAVEKKHLHKKAYADVKRFDRYESNEELARHWNTLLAYMEMRGILKRIDSVAELPLDGAAAEGDDEEDAGDAGEPETASEVEAEAGSGDNKVVQPRFGGSGRPSTRAH